MVSGMSLLEAVERVANEWTPRLVIVDKRLAKASSRERWSEMMISQPMQGVAFFAAGPRANRGELRGEHGRKFLDGKSLASKMPCQNKPNAQRFGLQTTVEAHLAREETLAAGVGRGNQEFARAAASDGHLRDRLIERTNGLQVVERKQTFDAPRQIAERRRLG
jgi:hypothetical protein